MLVRIAGAVVLLLTLLASMAQAAEKRVALVIGNSAYKYAGELLNPRNDAADIAAALKALKFEVIEGTDLDRGAMERKLREFARALEGSDVGLFFYAGHGLQAKGVNYLLGTDAKLEAERDLEFETLRLEAVLTHMEREAKTSIVFLDACRNNPLARNLARTMGTRGVNENSGLAPVAFALGTFVAFATQPGNVASDGSGRNSPFSAALKKRISEPGLALSDLMIEVRKEVVVATKGAQVPWDHSALQGRFYFNITINVSPPQPAPPGPQLLSAAASEWSRVDKTSIIELETFVRRHGSSPEAEYARARLADLKKQQVVIVTPPRPEPAPAAAPVSPTPGTWVLLACQQISPASDRGSLRAGQTAGRYKAIRLNIRGGDMELLELKVHYPDGVPNDISVHQVIRKGESTRPLHLMGYERPIDRIDMVYRLATDHVGLATVCVEGLRL